MIAAISLTNLAPEELEEKVQLWQRALADNGLPLSVKKTKFISSEQCAEPLDCQGKAATARCGNEDAEAPEKRPRGAPWKRWKDVIKRDLAEVGATADDALDSLGTILVVIIISGYVCSLATYLEVGFVSIGVEAEEAENVSVAHTFLYVGSALFIYGNFCLTIERWLASCIVSTYEKYSSSQLSLALTCLIVAVPPCILGIVISQVWTDQLISFLSFFAFSLVSGVVRDEVVLQQVNGHRTWLQGVLCGVGIIVSERFRDLIVSVERFNDLLMKIVVVAKERLYHFFANAPQTGCSDQAKDEFRSLLDEKTAEVPPKDVIIVAGQWARRYGSRNADGGRILEYAESHSLTIVNTVFRKRDSYLISYYSGCSKSQIGFVLVKDRDRSIVTDEKLVRPPHSIGR
ncbi:unnamed protein product [Heligmosomoides polygyrus]|uniref:PHM7_ext domain-containing protein n=1 Tax=Heligmosomoides polygyrus TaxID=6339 RepID=A0A183F2F2_HELPZ|nr:unnamed protein product [Heligmosomoides polygyrus]